MRGEVCRHVSEEKEVVIQYLAVGDIAHTCRIQAQWKGAGIPGAQRPRAAEDFSVEYEGASCGSPACQSCF